MTKHDKLLFIRKMLNDFSKSVDYDTIVDYEFSIDDLDESIQLANELIIQELWEKQTTDSESIT
tara:strand:- start:221 stop:412 length:192 start_codon:yes stop_codon:yes gene_type:complete